MRSAGVGTGVLAGEVRNRQCVARVFDRHTQSAPKIGDTAHRAAASPISWID